MSKTVRVITAIICALALCVRVETQDVTRVFLPLVVGRSRDMGVWNVIDPTATENMTLNPSAGTTGNFAQAFPGSVVSRVTTVSHFGSYSYRVQTNLDNEGIQFTLSALNNAIYFVTMRVQGTLPTAWDWSLDNVVYTAPTSIEVFGDWALYGLEFPAAQANGATLLYVRQNGAGAGDFNIDAIQVEEHDYWTTYCDGDQEGCEWSAAAHASTSSRSVLSRAGGRVREFSGEWQFHISSAPGTGMAPVSQNVDEFAILPGGEVQSFKIRPRTFSLIGIIRGDSLEDVHANRQGLLDVLKPDAVPETDQGPQPVILRYKGATITKDISAHYESGLEFAVRAEIECWERVAIRFIADDPFFYQVGEESDPLDSNDAVTLRYIAARFRSTGQWDDTGLTNNPTANGTILAIKYNPVDGRIYVGGDFTGMNNQGGRDYAAVYDPATDTWATLGAGGAVNNFVRTIAVAANGDVYFGGDFLNLGGGAGDYVAYWDISGAAWVPVAAGGTAGGVFALAFGLDGTLYIGGNFANWNGIGADRAVKYPVGGPYTVMDAGNELNAAVSAITVHPNGDIYLGGEFTQFGATVCNYWVRYDLTDYQVIDTGLDTFVRTLAIDESGNVFLGGLFSIAGGGPGNFVVEWDGQQFIQLGSGTNNDVLEIRFAPDGMLYVGGQFTTAGGITLADRVAKWNGSSWAHLDADLPGAPDVTAVEILPADPVVGRNYSAYFGFNTTGAAAIAGLITVANDGTEHAFPTMVISRSGGTTAVLESIRNETLGRELLFDYALLDGERLTIDLTPSQKSIVSSFFGNVPGAVLPNSDFGTFSLQSNNNDVTCFINESGTPTLGIFILWRETYWSAD